MVRGVLVFCFAWLLPAGYADDVVYTQHRSFYVVDGDTIHYAGRKLRLCGINAPDSEHRHYEGARQHLIALADAVPYLQMHFVEEDKYGREVVVLFPPPSASTQRAVSINEQMVADGWAWHFKRYSHTCPPQLTPRQLSRAHFFAKDHHRGMRALP